MENRIGINQEKAAELADKLNVLLANYQLYYQNLRGYHWNITGREFFDLHIKFEELYTVAQVSIDEVAERILTLGFTPLHTFSDYLEKSEIEASRDVTTAEGSVSGTLHGLKVLIQLEREIVALAGEAGDDGTDDLITAYIARQEKETWMLAAYMN